MLVHRDSQFDVEFQQLERPEPPRSRSPLVRRSPAFADVVHHGEVESVGDQLQRLRPRVIEPLPVHLGGREVAQDSRERGAARQTEGSGGPRRSDRKGVMVDVPTSRTLPRVSAIQPLFGGPRRRCPNVEQEFVSPREAAQLLAVSRRSIYRYITAGRLRAVKVGAARNAPLRVRKTDLVEQLRLPERQR